MTKHPFSVRNEGIDELLGFVHSNVCGPILVISNDICFYFVTFTSDFSRQGHAYLIKNEFDVYWKFIEYKNVPENQTN